MELFSSMYTGESLWGDIFRVLDDCQWKISRDRVVSVSGPLSQTGYSADVKVDFGVEPDNDIYVRSMLDRLYDMSRSNRQ